MGKEPYFFIYGQKPKYRIDVKGNLPENCQYPLLNADSADLIGFEGGAEILIQRLDSDPFVVDLIQLDLDKPFSFNYQVKKPRLFLYFMIEGIVDYYTADRIKISHAAAGRFYTTYNKQAKYKARFSATRNIVLVVTMKPGWAKKFFCSFPHLYEMIQRFQTGATTYEVLPHCFIDGTIRKYLVEVYSYSNENPGALNGTLRKYISLILERYNKLVGEKKESIAYKAKNSIDINFADANVSVESLASDLATTRKTLIKHFKYEFGITPYAYLIQVRVNFARVLIETSGQKASDVYWRVGYDDVKSFRAQYRKTFGERVLSKPDGERE